MTANHDPSLNDLPGPEQGPDSALLEGEGLAVRLHQILEDRGVPEDRLEAFLNLPVVRTGQIDVASRLKSEHATGTTELPRVKPLKHKHVNRQGGKSLNEGNDSDFDDNWNKPPTDITPEEAKSGDETTRELREAGRAARAHAKYVEDIKIHGIPVAIARLRNKGYIPDANTRGTTLIKIGSPAKPFSKD